MIKKQVLYRDHEAGKAKPKRRFFSALMGGGFKRHRSDTGLVEDRTSSVTVVRIIVGLLMVHLIIIGGVLLRGKMVKDGSAIAGSKSISPPPTQPAKHAETTATTTNTAAPAHRATQSASTHITQVTSGAPEDVAIDDGEDEVEITQPNAEPIIHRVKPGDTLEGIAAQYGVSAAAISAANPSLPHPAPGNTLFIPQHGAAAPQRTVARPTPVVQPTQPPAPAQPVRRNPEVVSPAAAPVYYTVQKGDTLSKIARDHKTTVKAIADLNKIADKDRNKIKIGDKLRVR